jgi:hypothetical protein
MKRRAFCFIVLIRNDLIYVFPVKFGDLYFPLLYL